MTELFKSIYKNKSVFVTGHTGFKGSWLTFWLEQMGAKVTGFALPAPTQPNHIGCLNMEINSIIGDIRDSVKLRQAMIDAKPEIVFHLAAQPIVRDSYNNPAGTYESNVTGTMNMCEACRATPSVRAIVSITTDKVYHNREWFWGYREIDELGGFDPYSSSKACAEILLASYRNSFFNVDNFGKSHNTLLASVRAGNVIGGGDWAKDRLIPDIMRAVSMNEKVTIRNPHATRPWQHVLECLSGYLLLGSKLLEGKTEFATPFNFGPPEEGALSVEQVVQATKKHWSSIHAEILPSEKNPHEARFLKLDCSKAFTMLGWRPTWNSESTFEHTVNWYRHYYTTGAVSTHDDLKNYIDDAKTREAVWTR